MSSAIDELPEAPGATDTSHLTGAVPVLFEQVQVTNVHQALSWYPVYRGTGLRLTEALAATAAAHNRTIPPEAPTAVRLKIRTDGAGVRFAKRRDEAGQWELCFTSLDPWLSDIVEHQTAEGSYWQLTVPSVDIVLTWTGTWDDHPDVTGLWLGNPWLRNSLRNDPAG